MSSALSIADTNGWINVYKPKGISSARLVAIVKKSFPKVKVGHTGTLDPLAEGVLPLALGEATKLAGFLINSTKEYIFTIQFGSNTTTGDEAGEVINRVDYYPSKDELLLVLDAFRGEQEQIPPKYSAIKIGGVRAYKLARTNSEFEIKPRKVHIYNLELLDFNANSGTAKLKVRCSKGTYVRSLAEDISLALQNLGYVIELRRTAAGIFTNENSVNISEYLEGDWQEARPLLEKNLLRLEVVLDDIPVLDATKEQVQLIKFGQKVTFDHEKNQFPFQLPDMSSNDNSKNPLLVWIRYNRRIVAIGNLQLDWVFKSQRVFNLIK